MDQVKKLIKDRNGDDNKGNRYRGRNVSKGEYNMKESSDKGNILASFEHNSKSVKSSREKYDKTQDKNAIKIKSEFVKHPNKVESNIDFYALAMSPLPKV